MAGFATQAKPQKFEEITPGSTIEISGSGIDPFEAIVVQMQPEFGPTSIPALIFTVKGDPEPQIVTASGQYQVRVLINASSVATDTPPDGALQVRLRPLDATAIQFKGGVTSAGTIIRWAIGKAAPRYQGATDQQAESIIFGGLGLPMAAQAGDWTTVEKRLGELGEACGGLRAEVVRLNLVVS